MTAGVGTLCLVRPVKIHRCRMRQLAVSAQGREKGQVATAVTIDGGPKRRQAGQLLGLLLVTVTLPIDQEQLQQDEVALAVVMAAVVFGQQLN